MIRMENIERRTSPDGMKISFLTHDIGEADEVFAKYREKPLQCKIEPVRAKRSLDANRYHYTLCDKMAKVLRTTTEEIHALLMRRHGTPFEDALGQNVFLYTHSEKTAPGIYLRPTGYKNHQGYEYIVIKPSHYYDTKEMSDLIDGTITDAKSLGIETATPDEIERMKAAWQAVDN